MSDYESPGAIETAAAQMNYQNALNGLPPANLNMDAYNAGLNDKAIFDLGRGTYQTSSSSGYSSSSGEGGGGVLAVLAIVAAIIIGAAYINGQEWNQSNSAPESVRTQVQTNTYNEAEVEAQQRQFRRTGSVTMPAPIAYYACKKKTTLCQPNDAYFVPIGQKVTIQRISGERVFVKIITTCENKKKCVLYFDARR